MRAEVKGAKLSVRAIAGSEVVLLAMAVKKTARAGLQGFAIGRVDANGDVQWFKGAKCYRSVVPTPNSDDEFSCDEHPLQSFIWGDYAADPATTYRYRVRALQGAPNDLQVIEEIDITVSTEDQSKGAHAIYFNRGAIASQAFAARFRNRKPQNIDDPNDPEVKWLSRGALEAFLAFVAQAGKGDELLVAAYEFTYAPVLLALKDAAKRGAKVTIVHEAGLARNSKTGRMEETSATSTAKAAIHQYELDIQPRLTLIQRTRRTAIPHNKFVVLVRGGKAIAVLTGSTNFTPSGFLGQTNVIHIVRDPATAEAYRDYWRQLSKDPPSDDLADWSESVQPHDGLDQKVATAAITPLFSPRPNDDMLAWYADEIAAAKETVMFTAAFGVNKLLAAQFAIARDFTRFILLEDAPNAKLAAQLKDDPDVIAAYGSILGQSGSTKKPLPATKLEDWFQREEHFRKQGNIFFIHTKFLMIDPLGPNPRTYTGSANFSTNSLENNDENMLLIREDASAPGGTRVADIYLTEFDRIFRHFWARQNINRTAAAGGNLAKAKFLDETSAWLDGYTVKGRRNTNRQRLFFPDWPN